MDRSVSWIVQVVCWGSFILVWLAGWLYNLVRGPRVQRRLLSVPILTIGVVLILIARLGILKSLNLAGILPSRWPVAAVVLPLWLETVGAAFLVAGTGFTLWARFALGTMWSNMPETKAGHQLRTDGPYAIARHPIYTGMISMLLGSLLMNGFGPWLLIAVVGAAIVLVKVPAEEKLMIETFGEQYRQYQQRVPQLIPGLLILKRAFRQ